MTLPNFIIAGAPRAGTTSLVSYLKQHPQIFMASGEPRYFLYGSESNSSEGLKLKISVRTMSDYAALFNGVTNEIAVGEKSPFYIYSENAIKNIRKTIPNIRLIFSLRHPIDRAYSAYWLDVRNGIKTLPVEEALTITSNYVTGGCYYAYLSKWYDYFDRSNINVVIFDDLKKSPQTVFQDLCHYLGVEGNFILSDTNAKNASGKPKSRIVARIFYSLRRSKVYKLSKPIVPDNLRNLTLQYRDKNVSKKIPIDKKLADRLESFYHDDINQLEKLLERDLSAWKSGF